MKNHFNIVLEKKNFLKLEKKFKNSYQKLKPFPHVVIENFFSKENLKNILKAFPAQNSKVWKSPGNKHTFNKKVLKTPISGNKDEILDLKSKLIFWQLNSSIFINFLEKISGIKGLMPDPYLYEAGFHSSGEGAYLNPHADFSHHDKIKLQRRINFIYFLSKDWKKKNNGSLKLYDKNINVVKEIIPKLNTGVIFSTSKNSYHGHPDKIIKGAKPRNSIAMYYYTVPVIKKPYRVIFPLDKKFSWRVPK